MATSGGFALLGLDEEIARRGARAGPDRGRRRGTRRPYPCGSCPCRRLPSPPDELNLLVVIEHEQCRRCSGRSVMNFKIGVGAFARRADRRRARPTTFCNPVQDGIVIGDANLLHRGQIDHANIEVPRVQRRRLRRNIRRLPASPRKEIESRSRPAAAACAPVPISRRFDSARTGGLCPSEGRPAAR